MKLVHRTLLLAAIILMALAANAELSGNFAEWGKVTAEDLNIKDCSFEKNADALLLLDLGQVNAGQFLYSPLKNKPCKKF